jgi:hypothetical protein
MTSLTHLRRRECNPADVSRLASEYRMRSGSVGRAEEAEHLFLYVLGELELLLAHANVERAHAELAHRWVEWCHASGGRAHARLTVARREIHPRTRPGEGGSSTRAGASWP